MSGSLTIVGLGPARVETVTLEAADVLRGATSASVRAYGTPHSAQLARQIAPDLVVRSIDYLYGLTAVQRPEAYRDLASMLTRRALEDGFDVLYIVPGSPLFYNDAAWHIRRACAERGLPLRLVHGMSFLDLVLDRVFWTGHSGLQLYSAWNVAVDGLTPSLDAPVILCQLGEWTAGGDALEEQGSLRQLHRLRDALTQRYPADHPVTILYSSGQPDYRSLARTVPLSALAAEPVPVYSNLFVPAVGGPPAEAEALTVDRAALVSRGSP